MIIVSNGEWTPDPKPAPKPKKDRKAQWYAMQKRSLEKKKLKMKPIHDEDEIFYRDIWNHTLHFCANCGKPLYKFDWDLFHHILDKENYPALRHEKLNIIILCGKFGCHGLAESAISYPKMKVYEYCESVKKEFLKDQYKPPTP